MTAHTHSTHSRIAVGRDDDDHRFDFDTDRCRCGGEVVYFADGDNDGLLGEGCEVNGRVFDPPECPVCEEPLTGDLGEFHDPVAPAHVDRSLVAHAECGLAEGWEVA